MKRLLSLALMLLMLLLSGCTISSNTGYVSKEEYDAVIDVTTLTVFDLDRDQDVIIRITGTEYSNSGDGYVCYTYVNTNTSTTELIDWEDCG